MRPIDADKYKEDLWVGHEYMDEDTLLTATNILDSQPTIEVKDLVVYHMDELSRTIHYKVVEAEPVRHGCPYCCDNGEGGHGRLKYSYDDYDGMAMSIHPSEKRKDGSRSLAWWATVHFRGEHRDFYIEACPFCGRRLVPFKEEYESASPICGAKMDGDNHDASKMEVVMD